MEEKYFAFLNAHPASPYDCGYANGYVAVPKSNPNHGKDYYEVGENIDVHGGLTFGHEMSDLKEPWKETAECIDFDSLDEIPDDYYVFGFDTMHYGDGAHLTREWCIEETKELMRQLKGLRRSDDEE